MPKKRKKHKNYIKIEPKGAEYKHYKKKLLNRWRKTIFKRDNHRCRYCGSDQNLQLAHITACQTFLDFYKKLVGWKKALELSFRKDNLVCLCGKCHSSYHSYVKDINGNIKHGKKVARFFYQLKQDRKWRTLKQLDWQQIGLYYRGRKRKLNKIKKAKRRVGVTKYVQNIAKKRDIALSYKQTPKYNEYSKKVKNKWAGGR